MSSRQNAVAGMFYPGSCNEIGNSIERFNQVLRDADYTVPTDFVPRALIVPHAGYVYSGFTANMAYKSALINNPRVKRTIVIGPSHKVYVNGASVALYDHYQTPCGDLEIDLSLSTGLKNSFDFLHFQPGAHQEHSTEVQMPFIHHYSRKTSIVEIVYGEIDYQQLSQCIDTLLEDTGNLIVISTDLSHFYTKNRAKILDSICINAIAELDLQQFDQGCEACGIIGVKAIVKSAKSHKFKSRILDYHTSADASGDESNVVGYTSALLG